MHFISFNDLYFLACIKGTINSKKRDSEVLVLGLNGLGCESVSRRKQKRREGTRSPLGRDRELEEHWTSDKKRHSQSVESWKSAPFQGLQRGGKEVREWERGTEKISWFMVGKETACYRKKVDPTKT